MCYPVCGIMHIKESLLLGVGLLIPAIAPPLVSQRSLYVLSCLWDNAYKRILAARCWSSRSTQCSTTGFTKVIVCGIMHIKEFLLLGVGLLRLS